MDATQLLVDYLNAQGLSVPAYPQNPQDTSGSFCVVELTGCDETNPIRSVHSLDVDCWAERRSEAATLADEVKQLVFAMVEIEPNVFHAEVTTTYNNPEPDSGHPRYTVGFDITTCN